MFVLSDRAGWGLQNFCTELWNSLIIQIYANLFKINEKCYISSISQRILIMFVLSDRAGWGLQNFCTELWNSLIMQIYAIFFKINEKCYIYKCANILPTNVKTSTNVQIFYSQMCKRPQMCKHFSHKCANL